jgi:diguanylate cyclase (GGDEF)-like protein/PAS domain S-box-containing protein
MTTPTRQRAFAHHLLVIDDKVDLLNSLKSLLEIHGFRVSTATSTEKAIEAIKQGNFDLILLDILMPQLSGHEVLRFVQEKRPDIPVIVISGDYSFSSVSTALKRGAFDFIRKPYVADELVNAIQNALEKRRLEYEYKTMQQRIQQSEKMHRFMVNNSPDIIYILNERGHFTFINDSVEKLLNVPKDELLGQHFSSLIGDDESRQHPFTFNERRASGRKAQNREIQMRRRLALNGDGKATTLSVPFEINAMGIYEVDKTGGKRQFRGTYGIARDITDRKQAESFMRFQAYHDLLTGLPNRSLFRDRLSLSISHAKRNGSKVAVMFLDVDRFKVVNDTLGHSVGDLLIQAIARRISNCLREGDTLSRFGGDEFTLLLPNINSQNDASIIARKIIAELKEVFYIEQHEIFISGSIGIALYPEHGDQIDTLIQNADIAMYHIKSHGKNGSQFFNDQMNQAFSERLSIEKDLRSCLEQQQLFLQYQPIYNVETGTVYALEAFLRWNHPERGVILPKDFLKIAEETGLLIDVGAWVVDQVCADLELWQNPVLKIAINFNPLQVEHPDFENMLMCAMQKHNVSPNQIEIEITEQLLSRDQAVIAAKLKRLTRLGFSIAVDNFGTGYSSLSCLHQMPIHTIKLDHSFLRHINDDRNSGDACIVNAIAAMANGLNLNLVAEGVETVAQKEYLSRLGCFTMQGHLFQKPVNSSEARNITVAPLLMPE